MSEKQDKPTANITPERVREFVETLDKLAFEKPAGFSAYMATCMSSMKMADFTEPKLADKVSDKKNAGP